MNRELEARGVPWSNCISFAADNAAVMSGHKKGVKAFVKTANEDIYFVGCPCHLLHLAAEKGASTLPAPIEDLVISIYYYLEKSSKRQMELRDLQILHDVEVRKILKHVSTRWLSLGVCLNRVLQQWTPLQHYFKEEKSSKQVVQKSSARSNPEKLSEKEKTCEKKQLPDGVTKSSKKTKEKEKKSETEKKTSEKCADQQSSKPSVGQQKAEKIYDKLKSTNFKLYCLFLKNVLPLFDNANKLLQNEKPCIQILHDVLDQLLRTILTRFVKPEVIVSATTTTAVHFEMLENQKEDRQLSVGDETRDYIDKHSHLDLKTFYESVRRYFCTVCKYMCKNFPFGDEVLLNAAVADVRKRREMDFSSVAFFVKRFRAISEHLKPGTVDDLEAQFLEFQIEKLPVEIVEADRADSAWALVGNLVDPATGGRKYDLLSKVMLDILVIFHSNTDCERIFSFVTKSKTKFRPNMSTATLSALVTHKVAMLSRGEKAFSVEIPARVLKSAKSATYCMLHQ